MATEKEFIRLPYRIAKSLLEEKIFNLNHEIERILKKWNQTSIEDFIQATREGKIPEAETDAIIVGNLHEKLLEFEQLYNDL